MHCRFPVSGDASYVRGSVAELGSWTPGSSWDRKRPEDLNATWILLRKLTNGAHCPNGDHAAR